MDTAAIIARAGELLTLVGWTRVEGSSMCINGKDFPVYEKTYETAVGPKVAFVCCRESREPDTVVFDSNYFSEGNNVLSGCSAYGMINNLTVQHVGAEIALARYIADVERTIDSSYARNLFLTFGHKA